MKKLLIPILLIVFILSVQAQDMSGLKGSDVCSFLKRNNPFPVINRGDSPNTPKHKFDVLDYKLNVDIRACFISPYPKNFNG